MAHQPPTSRLTGVDDPSPVTADPAVPGTVLAGRYRVGECIGAGAMGVVWSAFDRRLRRTVAVKQLVRRDHGPDGPDDPAGRRAARARALREGRIAGRVVHPRAIAVFDVVEHRGAPWLVMEHLRCRSLATVLAEQGPLEPAVVAHVGAQIADALAAVHDAGIVHGDVKPGNVLLTDDGVAKITDFGVSRASWDTTATGGDVVAGTPGYFAPEVARGGDPTPASDVFSLGATLYAAVENELVCGPLDNTLAVLHAMAEARLRPAVRAGVMGRPLAAMLHREPDHRPVPAAVRRALRSRAAAGPVRIAPAPVSGDATSGPAVPAAPGAEEPVPAPPGASSDVGAPFVPAPRPPQAPPHGPDEPHAPGEPDEPDGETVGEPARPRRQSRPRRAAVVLAAASAVVLGGAGGAVAALGGEDGGGDTPAVAAPAAPLAPFVPAPRAGVTPAAPPVAPPAPGADSPVGDAEAARTVTDYYGGLPGELDRSWATLAGAARDDSGGYGGYRRFWSGIRSVSASGVTVTDGTVRADIEFVTTTGVTTREQYRFEVGRDDDGRVIITSAKRAADAM